MLFIRLTYDFPSPLSKYSYTYKVLKVRALVGRNYHHPFRNFLFTYFIFNKMSLLFHLFFLILACSCPYLCNLICSTNLHVSTPYNSNNPQGKKVRKFKKSYNFSLRVHLMHHISIISFKLGHVSITKRRTLSHLFLFCLYDSSVLQNFKIFTPLLPHFSCDGSKHNNALESTRLSVSELRMLLLQR